MKDETKQKTKTFFDKVKKTFDRGINASKKALGVAGDAVQDFSDKSVLRIEKMQLETKQKKQFEMLGEYAYRILSSKNSSLKASDDKVSNIMKEIKRLASEIKIREDGLKEESAVKKTAVDNSEKKSASKSAVKKTVSSKKTAAAKKTSANKPASKKISKTAKKTASKK